MKNVKLIKILVLVILGAVLIPGLSFAATLTTLEGKIGGANCIIAEKVCPMNSSDPHIALENDFVLVTPDGKYYFMPNISRSLKTSILNKPVRVAGKLTGATFLVSVIELKKKGAYEEVWNWKKIVDDLNRGR